MEGGWGGGGLSCGRGLKVMALASGRSPMLFLKAMDDHKSWALADELRSTSASQCSTSASSSSHVESTWSPFSQRFGRRVQGRKVNRASGPPGAQVSLTVSVDVQESALEVIEWRSRNFPKGGDESLPSGAGDNEGGSVFAEDTEISGAVEQDEGSKILATESDSEDCSLNGERGGEATPDRLGGWRGLASPEDVAQANQSPVPISRRWRKLNSAQKRFKSASYILAPPPTKPRKKAPSNRDKNLETLFEALSSSRSSDRGNAIENYFESDPRELTGQSSKSDGVEESSARKEPPAISDAEEEGLADDPPASLLPSGNQRLNINLDLDLYRAKCLKCEGKPSEAEAILKECIKDWPDDGRAYLELGLLALPLRNDQESGPKSADRELRGGSVTILPGEGSSSGDAIASRTGFGANIVGTVTPLPSVDGAGRAGERLKINLDLQLYQAKCLRLKGRLDVSEAILRKCIRDWPSDGRPYIALGKQFARQNRVQDARDVYDAGCQAVRGENPYIWQAWAVLEEKAGDVSKARKLFDASTVADKEHVSAWHGWGKLELREGNVKRARSLLNKGLRYCGPNDYIFQTLASLECREGRIDQARSLLSRAVQFNPKSAPSWLAWGLMEADNNIPETARRLFQKAIEASPKNRFVWQAWALFEARQGREDRARELFQTGRELNPRDAVILQAFALFEYKCDRPLVARDLFRRALNCDSSHQPVYIDAKIIDAIEWQASVILESRKSDGAQCAVIKNVQGLLTEVLTLAWGWMEWKLGNLSVARDLYQGAIRVNAKSPDAARAFQAWGVLEDRAGDGGLARELFRCALEVDNQNVPALMSWAAMEERAGRSVRAEEIRLQFLQQRTEVVESSWDVDISDLFAPALHRIKGLFKGNQQARRPEPEALHEGKKVIEDLRQELKNPNSAKQGPVLQEEFDVKAFLKEKFPRRYGHIDRRKSLVRNSAQKFIE